VTRLLCNAMSVGSCPRYEISPSQRRTCMAIIIPDVQYSSVLVCVTEK
jgi:hypothetical protein